MAKGKGDEFCDTNNAKACKALFQAKRDKLKVMVPQVAQPLSKVVNPAGSLPDKMVTTDIVGNLCNYKCTACEFECRVWSKMAHHVGYCRGDRKVHILFYLFS